MNPKTTRSPRPEPLDDPLISVLAKSIRFAVRILALLMALVIWWGVADVVYVLYVRISNHPLYLLNISDILATFGAFMAVLIAIEIFINITSYLRENVIHIKIVLATAFRGLLAGRGKKCLYRQSRRALKNRSASIVRLLWS